MCSVKVSLLKTNPDRQLSANWNRGSLFPDLSSRMLKITALVEDMGSMLSRGSKSSAQESGDNTNDLGFHFRSAKMHEEQVSRAPDISPALGGEAIEACDSGGSTLMHVTRALDLVSVDITSCAGD